MTTTDRRTVPSASQPTAPERVRRIAERHPAAVAIEDEAGTHTFAEVDARAAAIASALCALHGASSLEGRRVVLLASPSASWVAAFLGVLAAGGIAVPLSPLYPSSELAWFAANAGAEIVLASADLADKASAMADGRALLWLESLVASRGSTPSAPSDAAGEAPSGTAVALLLYTSGTTGKPKGAMITHDNIAVHAALLRRAWGWREDDRLLHALPLHHLHGLGISLLTSLLAGATTRMLPRFDAIRVWDELGASTAFMAVPTMYQKLFEALDAATPEVRARWERSARALRLATSGSAALPVSLAERWRAITGTVPLERFGMTEIGVGMSNPLDPGGRRAGHVGLPLPSVELRLVDESGRDHPTGPAEAWVRGPSVFAGYWGREDATREAFVDGWFRTGDVAERSEGGHVRLLGRTSVDILKSGGYKLSALEVEEALRELPAVAEVSVVGIPDESWGDRVVAVIVPRTGCDADCAPDVVRGWAKERLAPYKVPREVIVVASLPRNAVGKVVKPDLVRAILAGTLRPAE